MLLWLLLPMVSLSFAAALPSGVSGSWYRASAPGWVYHGQSTLAGSGLESATGVSPTGGDFWFEGDFTVERSGRYVLDFKNSSVIGRFRQFIYDDQGRLVDRAEGGIQSPVDNPFFLRHGREFQLAPGKYRLIAELSGPFFLAAPDPYIDTLQHYREAIKPGNALTLVGLGVFLGLGIYYTALALVRRRVAEGMYALFILGNVLFDGSALQVFHDLFGAHWIYLVSLPILFSNCAYVVFVMALLEIRRRTQPRLYKFGVGLLALLGAFILLAAIMPNWSLELDRYGVGLFLTYGLTAGILRAKEGSVSAQLYLVAIAIFFSMGAVAISQSRLDGVYTLYIEHVGLAAVAVEVIMLALVLSYQFAQLHQERQNALERLEHSNRIAHTDALTGLANRYALDIELEQLPLQGSLTFLDLDALKYYNDRFGHARGDELLRTFARVLANSLASKARLFRIGGDEFAVTCPGGDLEWLEAVLVESIAEMRNTGFEFAGASAGSVYIYESASKGELKHLADSRMYENKRKRKSGERMPPVVQGV